MSDTTPERKANDGAAAEAVDTDARNTDASGTEAVSTDAFDNDAFAEGTAGGASTVDAAASEAADASTRTEPTNDEAIELAYEPEPEPRAEAPVEQAAVPAVDFSAAPVEGSNPDAAAPVVEVAPAEAAPEKAAPVYVAPPALVPPPAAETQPYVAPIDYAAAAETTREAAPVSEVAPAVAVATAAAATSATSGALYDPNTVAPVGQYVPAPQPIFVQAPTPPANKGNRAVGILIGLLATVVFAVLYAGCTYLVSLSQNPGVEKASESFSLFVTNAVFYVPVLFFFGAFALLVAIVNRGGWWAYVLGAFAVAVIVYFSYIGGALLTVRAWEMTPSQAGQFIASQWLNPVAIIAAIAAREVPIWFGAWIAARGRKVTERNVAARQEYDRVLAEGPSITRP